MATKKQLTFQERKQQLRAQMEAVTNAAYKKKNELQEQFDAIDEEERKFELKKVHDNVDLLLQFAEHSEKDGDDEKCIKNNRRCSEYCPRCALLELKKYGVDVIEGKFTITIKYDE